MYAVFFDQYAERARVEQVEFAEHDIHFRRRGNAKGSLMLGREAVPHINVERQGADGTGFVEPRPVVILGQFLKAEGHVVPGPDPFRGVYDAALQGRVNLGAGQGLCVGAEPPQYLAAEAWHADLEALQVLQRIDFLVEPAPHLRPVAAGHERLEVESPRQFVPEFLAAAVVNP